MVPRNFVISRLPCDGRAIAPAMPVGRRGETLLHQRSAAIVPHDLPIGHAVARADRLLGKMRCGRRLMRGRCSHAFAGDACVWREHEPYGPDGGRDWRGGCQCRPSGDSDANSASAGRAAVAAAAPIPAGEPAASRRALAAAQPALVGALAIARTSELRRQE